MGFQTGLYFGIILAAVCMTGFLAFQAWRQREVPGAGYYFLLALALCFISMGETLSMTVSTEALSLFWFKSRFLGFAVIPPLWLLFVLEYSGRRHWLSKKLGVGLFVVPLITCAMVLTSSRHGLWVQQEVGFHREGPFWMAEISSRIPGIWYLIHTFYTQAAMLTGSVLLLLTARRKANHDRLQAVLLSASAIIPVIASAFILFKLLPAGSFNPTIPSLVAGTALAAAAIFRFDFLKKALASYENAMQPADHRAKPSQALFGLIFGLLAIALMAAGYLSYINFEKHFRSQVEDQLSAVADLTVNRLTDWRSERLGDAEFLRNSPSFSALVQAYLENPTDKPFVDMLQAWLDSLHKVYRYDRVFLMDINGQERITSSHASEPLAPHLIQDAAKVLSSGETMFLDFHSHAIENTIRLAFLVPIYADASINHPLGILVLEIDPALSLYPFLKQWPISSKTAEILLVRQDKEDVLFLNELRFQQQTALNLRIPLTETKVLAVKAVLGENGYVEGKDYKGDPAVGFVRAVPDSPWFIVTRMDQDEIYAPLRQRLWRTFLFISALMAFPGTGLMLAIRRQQMRYYKERVKSLEALRISEADLKTSEERFRSTFEQAAVGIAQVGLDGSWMLVNQQLCVIVGRTREELLQCSFQDITHPEDLDIDLSFVRQILAGEISTYSMEKRYIRKDRSLVWANLTVGLMRNEAGTPKYFVSVVEDITKRKKAEAEVLKLNAELEQRVIERTYQLEAANSELEAFTYSVSHDLRAPLRHINGYINLLVDRLPEVLPEKGRHYFKNIVDSATEMGELIDSLLKFSRTGRQEMRKTLINMNDLFKEALNTVIQNHPERVIQWETTELPVVSGDPALLKLVWINLLDNAVKFTKNKDRAKIEIGFTEEKKDYIFFVHDNGAGFDMQYAHKLFGVFQRLHSAADYEGTGIGLANVRRIILRHGGRTWAEAEPGKGAKFYFTLQR